MSVRKKIAFKAFEKEYGEDIEIQTGVHKRVGDITYLVVQPENKEDVLKYFWLEQDTYKIKRKICGCINSYEKKKRNEKCIYHSGWKDHKGIGYCFKHKRKEGIENKFKRKYLSDMFQTGRGKAPIYINLLKAFESQPFETEHQLESLFHNLLAAFISQLEGWSHYKQVEEKGKTKLSEEEIAGLRGQNFLDNWKAIMAYTKQLESLANSIAMLRREIHFSPVQVFKWLDEAKDRLEGVLGPEVAHEAIYHIVSVKGLLNKTQLKEGVVIDAAFMAKEKSLLAALPLGYAGRIEDADFEDIANGKKK